MIGATLAELSAALAARKVSSEELTRAFLDRVRKLNGELNAFITVDEDYSLARARLADAARAGGGAGPLTGIPLAHKDILCTRELRTTCGSRMLAGYNSPNDAHVVEQLDRAGAVVLGKCNMDEFAMGSSNESSYFGPARNPWDRRRVPGGSIRQPASFCGVVGLMPTYGRVSRYGLIAFASSLDHIGPLTRSVKDAALVLRIIAGRDPMDSTSADVPVPDYVAELDQPIRGLRLGVAKEYFGEGLDPEVRAGVEQAIQKLAALGCEVIPISLPHTGYAIPTYYLVATAEASANLARFDGVRYGHRSAQARTLSEMYERSRDEGFGPEVKRRIMLGTYALSAGYYDAYYLKAQRVRTLLTRDFEEAFQKVDAIVTPTSPTAAFKLGEKADDPLAMYLADIYTVTADLVGVPGISLPCGQTREKLPIGLQILGRHFDEPTILRIAHAYEQARKN